MQEKSPNPLGLAPSTWIAMAVAVMGIFALKQYPFQDTRPRDLWVPVYSHTATEDQDVEARLWQDPMAAVETARRVSEASAKVIEASVKANKDKPTASVAPEKFSCVSTPVNGVPDPDAHSPKHLCQSILRKLQETPGGILVMGAMVSGAPYAADIENRRRTRYAVLAGLYRSGYMPVNNQHVGYVRLAEYYDDPTRANDLAAFEWFSDDDAAKKPRAARVLLLWLDQDGFRIGPIKQLSAIADGILPTGVPTVILGPADSDGLRAMADESQKSEEAGSPGSRQFNIYSPWATASGNAIVHNAKASQEKQSPPPMRGVHLYRGVVTDDDVATAVLRELHDRGVQRGEIALIAERDTLYARAMGQYFHGCANAVRDDPNTTDPDAQSLPLCLTYLKGLDGIGPPPPKQVAAPTGANATDVKSSEPPSRADAAPDASTGPRQLDYLRRMGVTLRAMQGAPLGGCNPAGTHDPGCPRRYIKAIGVLGTDIYDKLLVLQELRPMFPDVVFFTFGLDARYTDDANLPWTRQLLVGSTLGLSLRPELQGDIPAFRDSYQATTFYSALLALHRASAAPGTEHKHELPDDAGFQWTSKAMVFEIGRTQPLDLLMDKDAEKPCNYDGDCLSISANRTRSFTHAVTQAAASWLFVLVPVLLWIMLRAAFGMSVMWRRPHFLGLSLTALIVVLAIAGAVLMHFAGFWHVVQNYLTSNGNRMPVPIADGASHWGKELLEACLIPLVIALLIRGQRKLNNNTEKIRREFGFTKTYRWLTRCYGSVVGGWSWKRKAKEWAYFPFASLSHDEDRPPLLAGISALESLIARYLYRGIGPRRFARVVIATVVFILVLKFLEWLGFQLFADVPWAGSQVRKHGAEGWIAFLCFTFTQLLIFWVIDAILLTRAFLLAVERDEPQWPTDSAGKTHPELGLPDDLAPIWLNLRLIARRTHWVGNFIWYPSLVIAGMIAATFTMEYGQYRFEANPITLMVSIVLIVATVVALRQAAESWRADLLQRFANRRLVLLAAQPPKQQEVTQLQVLIDLVTQLHDGAFAPYSEQPLVRAVLLPAVTFLATAGLPFLRGG
jgi:uncharacterized membrane protein YidH (DUF202 family)